MSKDRINWKSLRDYRCPMKGCGALLKEFKREELHNHQCTACTFKISNLKLSIIIKNEKNTS